MRRLIPLSILLSLTACDPEEDTLHADAEFRAATVLTAGNCHQTGGVRVCLDGGNIVRIDGNNNNNDVEVFVWKDWSTRTVTLDIALETNDDPVWTMSTSMHAFDGVDQTVNPLATSYFYINARMGQGRDYLRVGQYVDNEHLVPWFSDWGAATGWIYDATYGYSEGEPSVYGEVYGQGGDDILIGLTHADGGDGGDYIVGTRWADVLKGGENGDEIYGGEGDDELLGQGGTRDKLYGQGGDDDLDDGASQQNETHRIVCDGGSGSDSCSCPSPAKSNCG